MSKKKNGSRSSVGGHGQAGGNEYEVGYCRPPKHSQFKPGRSGNSKGRPKGAENFATIVKRRLAQRIELRESGKVHKVTALEAGIARLVDQTLRGNHRAMGLFFNLARSVEPAKGSFNWEEMLPLLSDEELDFLERIFRRFYEFKGVVVK